jgi:hypothetical protein
MRLLKREKVEKAIIIVGTYIPTYINRYVGRKVDR